MTIYKKTPPHLKSACEYYYGTGGFQHGIKPPTKHKIVNVCNMWLKNLSVEQKHLFRKNFMNKRLTVIYQEDNNRLPRVSYMGRVVVRCTKSYKKELDDLGLGNLKL